MAVTESEVLDRHVQSLKEAKECCRLLAQNQDPLLIAPRGHNYGNLKRALKQLEGTARQMNYMREDTRWIRLGVLYGKAIHTCQHLFANEDWAAFGKLTALFENGLVRMNELATTKTGQRGPILPTRPSTWLIVPDQKPIRPKRMMLN